MDQWIILYYFSIIFSLNYLIVLNDLFQNNIYKYYLMISEYVKYFYGVINLKRFEFLKIGFRA